MKRILRIVFAVILMASFIAFGGAAKAEASSPCAGSRIDGGPLALQAISTGPFAGHWDLYYSSSNGGTNCLLVYDDLAGSHHLTANIKVEGGNWDLDDAVYSTYAGPVHAYGTSGKCIEVQAVLYMNGTGAVYLPTINTTFQFHCK